MADADALWAEMILNRRITSVQILLHLLRDRGLECAIFNFDMTTIVKNNSF